MMRKCLLALFAMLWLGELHAQQVIYAGLQDWVAGRGDTLSILKVEKRSKNKLMLSGGADYRIWAEDNEGLCRYLKSRCYMVKVDTALYVNCKKVRYKRFRFGGWYAPAMQVGDKIYFKAQPVGSIAADKITSPEKAKLGGDVGDALASSALVFERVYYELDPRTGKVEFVGKDKMHALLKDNPALQAKLLAESSEAAEVMESYLLSLK